MSTDPHSRPATPLSTEMDRRVVLKAAGALGALAALAAAKRTTELGQVPSAEAASPAARVERWFERANNATLALDGRGWKTARFDGTYFAFGANWLPVGGGNVSLEMRLSADGKTFGDTVTTSPDTEDGHRKNREGRIFAHLVFGPESGVAAIRYRVLDGSGDPVNLPGFSISAIDAMGGPSPSSIGTASLPALTKPAVISRAGWGCNESYRFDSYGQIWIPEYRLVRHAIVHHTVTPTWNNGAATVRSVYVYHALEREWGDIGYNFLVDSWGNIYEGRYGGENVIGGHAFQFSTGSAGIAALGTFSYDAISTAGRSALVAIVAWCVRNNDPLGTRTFDAKPNCPTIAGHRDVNDSDCPGDGLYVDLPTIRSRVAEVLNVTDGPVSAPVPSVSGFKTGDNAITTSSVNMRRQPSLSATTVKTLSSGVHVAVMSVAHNFDSLSWYYCFDVTGAEGWVAGQYLAAAPIGTVPAQTFFITDTVNAGPNGMNLRRGPGIAQVIQKTVTATTSFVVSDGPVPATGKLWYGVWNSTLRGGWVTQEELRLVAMGNRGTLALSATKLRPLSTFTATAKSFPANTLVTFLFDTLELGTALSDGSGVATLATRVPIVVRGDHTVRATAAGSFNAIATMTVTPRITLVPATSLPGESVKIVLRGFARYETVTILWQTTATSRVITTVKVGSIGTKSFYITVPKGAKDGDYVKASGNGASTRWQFRYSALPTPTPEQSIQSSPTASPDPNVSPSGTPAATATTPPTEMPTPTTAPTETPVQTPPTATPTASG